MNRKAFVISSLLVAALGAAMMNAQEPMEEAVPPPPMFMLQGPEEGLAVGFGERIELLGFEGVHPGKVVTGAPFSATATTERTQTLADGTVIRRTTSSALYRDSQGRSRREITLSGFGPLENAGKSHTVITINDPVAGAHYVLEADEKIARKMPLKGRGHGGRAGGNVVFEQRMERRMQKEEASGEVQKQSLGTQTINGVNAEGTRVTRTIPVGQIGNDKPIQVVSERWYSPDLQMVVKSTHTDPRFGASIYTLTNVQRTEPSASLFTVPADYTVKQGGPGKRVFTFHREGPGAPALPPPPEN